MIIVSSKPRVIRAIVRCVKGLDGSTAYTRENGGMVAVVVENLPEFAEEFLQLFPGVIPFYREWIVLGIEDKGMPAWKEWHPRGFSIPLLGKYAETGQRPMEVVDMSGDIFTSP